MGFTRFERIKKRGKAYRIIPYNIVLTPTEMSVDVSAEVKPPKDPEISRCTAETLDNVFDPRWQSQNLEQSEDTELASRAFATLRDTIVVDTSNGLRRLRGCQRPMAVDQLDLEPRREPLQRAAKRRKLS